LNEHKQKAEAIPKLEAALNQFRAQMSVLPQEVLTIVEAASTGQDYRSIIKDLAAAADVDLSKPFSDHSVVSIIQKYVNPGINQAAFDAMDEANKQALTTLAKSKYDTTRTNWQRATSDKTAERNLQQQKFEQSIQQSLQVLKTKFPDMGQEAFKVVADKMAFGLKDSLFNPDNTYKPDAAVKVAMQEFGEESIRSQWSTIGDLAQKIASKIQGQTNEQYLGRSDKPDQQGRKAVETADVVAEIVKRETSFVNAR